MDLFEFFDDYDIEFFTKGKNVSVGWVNINCCFCDDISNHLGIRLEDLRVHCWKCGAHSLVDLIREVAECSLDEAQRLRKVLAAGRTDPPQDVGKLTASSVKSRKVLLPQESSIHFPKLHLEYLEQRGFRPRPLIRKYKLQAVHTIGRYKFRIIIPIFMNNRLVSFTSRDVTDEQEPKYKHAKPQEAILSKGNLVYNYDTLIPGADAFLVEGPIDVWKLGDGAVSLLGVRHTMEQVRLLMKKNIRTLFIFFDNDKDGRKTARYFAQLMTPFVKTCEIIFLKERGKDPGALTLTEAQTLKERLEFQYVT